MLLPNLLGPASSWCKYGVCCLFSLGANAKDNSPLCVFDTTTKSNWKTWPRFQLKTHGPKQTELTPFRPRPPRPRPPHASCPLGALRPHPRPRPDGHPKQTAAPRDRCATDGHPPQMAAPRSELRRRATARHPPQTAARPVVAIGRALEGRADRADEACLTESMVGGLPHSRPTA